MAILLSSIPVRKNADEAGIFLFRKEDSNLIIQGTHVIYSLDSVGKNIYESIDGIKSIKEIIKDFAQKYGFDKKISKDILMYIGCLLNKGLIEIK